MGQKRREDNIPAVLRNSTTSLSWSGTKNGLVTRVTLGGQQYKAAGNMALNTGTVGFGGIDTGSFSVSTVYNIFAVQSSGVLGMVISASTAPTGFTSYRFLGKLISTSTPATISHVMQLGENFVEYLSNSSAANADDTTSFVNGAQGSQGIIGVTNINTERLRRIRALVAWQANDTRRIQVRGTGVTEQWVEFQYQNGEMIQGNQGPGAGRYSGIAIPGAPVNTTDMDIQFYRWRLPTTSYGATGEPWNTASIYFWRVEKMSGPITGP